MIKLTNMEITGWNAALRGMRNPLNSWDRADSTFFAEYNKFPVIGEKDKELAKKLIRGGAVHSKFMRMITVTCDITAPLYWWKEFDTYKVGTVANSCSTMHKIHAKEFELEDFSTEHLDDLSTKVLMMTIDLMNRNREQYKKSLNKFYWWQMIQLLPTSYNQKRTVQLNYEVLRNIYAWRKDHKLDEWRTFCLWIETLPHADLITEGLHED